MKILCRELLTGTTKSFKGTRSKINIKRNQLHSYKTTRKYSRKEIHIYRNVRVWVRNLIKDA